MNSLFASETWLASDSYVTPEDDLARQGFDPTRFDMGRACLITFSSSLFRHMLQRFPQAEEDIPWPFETTPLRVCLTPSGQRFGLHFPSYGSTRIANSLEQLRACGYTYVLGLGLGGALQPYIQVGDIVLLEGAVRGDGASRYYAPAEFPAVADFTLVEMLATTLRRHGLPFHLGLSFSIDALYREAPSLIERLRALDVLIIDLESSAFLTVARRLGMKACWAGVVSDRLVGDKHEGSIHTDHIVDTLARLGEYMVGVIEEQGQSQR